MKANNFNYLPCLMSKVADKTVKFYLIEENGDILITYVAPTEGKKTKAVATIKMLPDHIKLVSHETFIKDTNITLGDAIIAAINNSLPVLAPLLGTQIKSDALIVLVLALTGNKVGDVTNNTARIEYPVSLPTILKSYLTDKQLEHPILEYLSTPAE